MLLANFTVDVEHVWDAAGNAARKSKCVRDGTTGRVMRVRKENMSVRCVELN